MESGDCMKMTEKDVLLGYFCNELDRIETEMVETRNRIRFRCIGIEDNVEMILIQQRLNDFREFAQNVRAILHLGKE